MQSLIRHARDYREIVSDRSGDFAALAEGQKPQGLFITCSDSRVVPALLTGAQPGELFEIRNAGNIVPPHGLRRPCGVAATIEYAVTVLEVPDIVVCGHSHCAAVTAVVTDQDLSAMPAVRDWLRLAQPRPNAGKTTSGEAAGSVSAAIHEHVVAQLERLAEYPFVATRVRAGRLRLHGWFYEIDTGTVRTYSARERAFRPL
ncbi:carbonic anhydrase [Embleya sp. NBC_00896]|uniref:carbonic anhydrase n=1 Tax=Embleya sp. NBC_00896 TaxID=2975961 RepID=UPI002F90E8B9|nr:carbonic anhydrase [Embleya sp. NBC_00896]